MANSTLLSLMQTTMQGMGVAGYGLPATVISNTNQDVVQTLALVNAEAGAVAREHQWQALRTQYLFTATYFAYTGNATINSLNLTGMSSVASLDSTFAVTGTGVAQDSYVASAAATTVVMNQVATASTTGGTTTYTFSKVRFAPPSDFDRPVDRTQWDKSKHWEMLGPITAQQEEWLRSGYISTGPRIRYWMQQGYFQIWPPLGVTESLSYEYMSKYWIFATAATAPTKELFTVDTDTCIFPDPLMRAMIRLKYFEAKGFDTTAYLKAYNSALDLAKAHDAGNQTLAMNPRPGSILIGYGNIPDGNYGT